MLRNYDSEGFDFYGYSAFDAAGVFKDHGRGVDRLGYTPDDYPSMTAQEFENVAAGQQRNQS